MKMLHGKFFHTWFVASMIIIFSHSSFAEEFSHDTWQQLLSDHVSLNASGHSTQVDYAGMKQDQSKLNDYLAALAQVPRSTFDSWPKDKQLAFLINAYNAATVSLILTKYPDVTSIKDLGSFFSSPWSKSFVSLLGEKRTLDDIEHSFIRGSGVYPKGFQEPRIHFAVNCASIGCPALRNEAYEGGKLEQQLESQTQQFLADKSRNRVENKTVYLSSIFKWYRDDFAAGWKGTESLNEFLLLYASSLKLNPEQQKSLASGDMDIEFLDYDWRLNDKR
ncbi:MAG: DUF547 domain-containing protein [Oleibacter sp.]|nr:DUF547 domain-containing protein [Thalassolituus sp.]